MATFIPDLKYIENDKMEPHTEGEIRLLHLLDNLDKDYCVYFQSHINYNHPDIVVLHPRRGALIIEVKDWDLSSYTLAIDPEREEYGSLSLKNGNANGLITPFEQVEKYKDDLYRLLSPELCYSMIRSSSAYRIVRTAVYFSESTEADVRRLFVSSGKLGSVKARKKYGRYITWWTGADDNSIVDQIREVMEEDELYTPAIHKDLTGIFSLSNEWVEQGEPFELDDAQKELARPEPGKRTRICGVAGSGKTFVIAQKAINCYLNNHSKVLILTYNITVCNYIRDKIARNTRKSDGTAGMSNQDRSRAFELIHFDSFLSELIASCGLKPVDRSKYEDKYKNLQWDRYQKAQMDLLKANASLIKKYKTVIIDEAQDYKYAWFSFIEDYVAEKDAEILIAADEKQNIYSRRLGENKRVRIPGFGNSDWKKLGKNYRMNKYNYALAVSFQHKYLAEKYEVDKQVQFTLMEEGTQGFRLFCDYTGQKDLYRLLFDLIRNKCVRDSKISPNDICVLSDNVYTLQRLDQYLRNHHQETMTMFEPLDIYRQCRRKSRVDEPCDEEVKKTRKARLDNDVSLVRSQKKRAFRMNPGTVKLSTIHSFKGWEIDTVILVIDNHDDAEEKDELIYTAITRAKTNLIIVSNGNTRYLPFIRENSDLITSVKA